MIKFLLKFFGFNEINDTVTVNNDKNMIKLTGQNLTEFISWVYHTESDGAVGCPYMRKMSIKDHVFEQLNNLGILKTLYLQFYWLTCRSDQCEKVTEVFESIDIKWNDLSIPSKQRLLNQLDKVTNQNEFKIEQSIYL